MEIASISALNAAKSRDMIKGSPKVKVTYATSTTNKISNAKK